MSPPKVVLFVPNTVDSSLANEIRETVQSLRPWTALNLKIIERGGDKLQDILCKSNPWGGEDCKREDCFTCEVATKFGHCSFKNCHQRSVLYETWCKRCKREVEREEKEMKENNKKLENMEKKRIRENEKENTNIYRYTGC